MLKFLCRIFRKPTRNVGSDKEKNLDDNDPVVKVREIDEPKFELTFTSSENSNHCEYHLVVEKPNCCYICKQLLNPPKSQYEIPQNLLAVEYPDVPITNTASMINLCDNWSSWSAWDFRDTGITTTQKLDQFKIVTDIANRKTGFKKFRRYCKTCVAKTFIAQMENQQNIRAYTFDSRVLSFKCLFCEDFAKTPHYISTGKVMGFMDCLMPEDRHLKARFQTVYDLYINEHNIRNKHCPVANCRYYSSLTVDSCIDCPEHGLFCTNCFEKRTSDSHHCLGLPRGLQSLELRRCPECSSLVEKRGGCDQLTCLCGRHFYWSKVKPIENPKKRIRVVKKTTN
jgi:hypothetical protein